MIYQNKKLSKYYNLVSKRLEIESWAVIVFLSVSLFISALLKYYA